ncbi:hypothetical protein DsansV1_C19g0161871 [Dioscorea sansibarensis]
MLIWIHYKFGLFLHRFSSMCSTTFIFTLFYLPIFICCYSYFPFLICCGPFDFMFLGSYHGCCYLLFHLFNSFAMLCSSKISYYCS